MGLSLSELIFYALHKINAVIPQSSLTCDVSPYGFSYFDHKLTKISQKNMKLQMSI